MDPISIALAAAGLFKGFSDSAAAKRAAATGTAAQRENIAQQQQALAFQQQNLVNALAAARAGQLEARPEITRGRAALEAGQREARGVEEERLRTAGGVRYDQFGNATFYDPTQRRWVTTYTPEQQRIISAEQARQGRTLARGAQASEDYARQRAGYLYRQPPSEEAIRAEITNLINQSMGTGERALNTLTSRWGARTRGNIPTLVGPDTEPSPGQRLAETMLQARRAALEERQARVKGHQAEFLPGMEAFERTANITAPEGTTGRGIVGMERAGAQDILGALSEYGKTLGTQGAQSAEYATGSAKQLADFGKVLADVYRTGGAGVGSAYTNIGRAYGTLGSAQAGEAKAATSGPDVSDFVKIATLLQEKPKTAAQLKAEGLLAGGTTGGTTGARAGRGTPSSWDRRFSFGPTTRGAGGEAAPFGGVSLADYAIARQLAEEEGRPSDIVAKRFGDWQF